VFNVHRILNNNQHYYYARIISTVEVEVKLRPPVSRPVYRGVELPSGTHDQIFFCIENYGFLDVGRPL
jgi:hypothetical protein